MIVLDVESSGLTPDTHSILSIGALDLDEPTNRFYGECRVWDGAHIDDDALTINGFTRASIEGEESKSKQSEGELIERFVAWALDRPKDRTLAAQNVTFDRLFVEAACARAKIACPFAHRTIDVHSLVWLHMTEHGKEVPVGKGHSQINLSFALRYVGVPEEPKPHNALTGALCHAEVIARIAYTKKLLPEFNAYDIPWETSL